MLGRRPVLPNQSLNLNLKSARSVSFVHQYDVIEQKVYTKCAKLVDEKIIDCFIM